MSMPFKDQPLVLSGEGGLALRVLGSGSARGAVFRTADGRPVVQDPNTGFFRVADAGAGAGTAGVALALGKPRWQDRRDVASAHPDPAVRDLLWSGGQVAAGASRFQGQPRHPRVPGRLVDDRVQERRLRHVDHRSGGAARHRHGVRQPEVLHPL